MILFFTSPIGLGHATRDVAICQQLYSIKKDDILFITGKPASEIFSINGFNVLDLYNPHKFSINDSMELTSIKRWMMKYLLYYRKCKTIAQDIVNKHKDCAIVSDEDFAAVAVCEKSDKKRILITDLTSTHFLNGFYAFLEERMNKSIKNIIEKCDLVIIPDYGYNKDNIEFVGPIVRNLSTTNRGQLRKKFGMDKQTIIITIGGTASGKYLIEMSLKSYKKLAAKLDIKLILASGPSELREDVDGTYVKNLGFVPNLHEYIYACDLVISLAGRSTIDECTVYGTPGIFIPIRNHFEQEQNAKRLGYRYDDIFRLDYLIEQKLKNSRNSQKNGLNGAMSAAKAIEHILYS